MGVIYAPRGGGDDIECGEDLRILQGQQEKKGEKKSEQAVMNQGIIKFDWGFDSVDNIHVLCGEQEANTQKKSGSLPCAYCGRLSR